MVLNGALVRKLDSTRLDPTQTWLSGFTRNAPDQVCKKLGPTCPSYALLVTLVSYMDPLVEHGWSFLIQQLIRPLPANWACIAKRPKSMPTSGF